MSRCKQQKSTLHKQMRSRSCRFEHLQNRELMAADVLAAGVSVPAECGAPQVELAPQVVDASIADGQVFSHDAELMPNLLTNADAMGAHDAALLQVVDQRALAFGQGPHGPTGQARPLNDFDLDEPSNDKDDGNRRGRHNWASAGFADDFDRFHKALSELSESAGEELFEGMHAMNAAALKSYILTNVEHAAGLPADYGFNFHRSMMRTRNSLYTPGIVANEVNRDRSNEAIRPSIIFRDPSDTSFAFFLWSNKDGELSYRRLHIGARTP